MSPPRRTPRGVRGLKLDYYMGDRMDVAGRTPRGVRGLKWFMRYQ